MRLFVGGIPYATSEDDLRALFAPQGVVSSVDLVVDRFTGQPRGFGFVDMPNVAEAQQAIRALDGKQFGGRVLAVNEAKPREARVADRGVGTTVGGRRR